MNELVILGVGNVLRQDDGLGVVALHRLRAAYDPPPGVRLVDGGALGSPLLDLFDPARELLILGAVRAAGAPGTLVRRDGASAELGDLLAKDRSALAEPLAAARWMGRPPAKVTLLGLIPSALGDGAARSAEVEAAIPTLIAAALAELEDSGRPMRRRQHPHDAPHPATRLDVARALGV